MNNIKKMRFASGVVSLILLEIEKFISVGKTGKDLENIALKIMKEKGVKSSSFGYGGFPSHICVSVNDEITHGIPKNLVFKNGDIVSVDVACSYRGFHADAARTFLVFSEDNSNKEDFIEKKKLVEVTKNALDNSIKMIIPGKTTNKQIGIFIQKYVEKEGYFVIKEYGGHGIGKNLHEDPFIPNCKIDEIEEFIIMPGMVICIEPLVQINDDKITLKDFVVLSKNGNLSAHFEHMILINKKDVEILV